MGTNKKGEQTKEYIYNVAKQLFYDIGYKNTTLSKIAETAQVPIGLIPYHFTNKDTIVSFIYQELIEKIKTRMLEYTNLHFDNYILFHAVLSRIYYQVIFSDPNNRRFYYEILLKKSNYKILNSVIGEVYKKYMADFDIALTEAEFNDILHADFGARREFILYHLERSEPMDIQGMVTFAVGIVPRLLKIDPHTVDVLLDNSVELYESMEFDDIRFLM
jgi:AcrR family transcriptional regulator